MAVFSRENAAHDALLDVDSKTVILGSMDRDEELPISVHLAMCPAERERDLYGLLIVSGRYYEQA